MRVQSKYIVRAAVGALLALLAACGDTSAPTAPDATARRVTMSGVTLVVTNANDAGPGSLRNAVGVASSGDLITFDPALSGATINVTNAIFATASMVVEGPTGGITIRASGNSSTFVTIAAPETEIILKRLTFTGGSVGGVGVNGGTLQLEDCVVEGNEGEIGGGVAIGTGTLKLVRTTVRNNTARVSGGGVYVRYGSTASIENSSISGNTATTSGGGIQADGEVTVTGSTVSGNTAGFGGGLFATDMVVVRNSTVSGNNAPKASNIYGGDEVTLEHSTIVGNTSGSSLSLDATAIARNSIFSSPIENCGLGASLFLEGANVFSDNSCPLTSPAIIADAKLAPLAVDGLTAVHRLLAGSPAINAAPSCLVNVDQRGAPRPLGGACDLGSVEEPVPLLVTPASAAAGTINSKTGVVLINGNVTCSVDGAVTFNATLEQAQKSGKVNFVLKASTPVQATCVGGSALWSAFTIPASGAFTNGNATVKLSVSSAGGVTPFNSSTAIRLNWAK